MLRVTDLVREPFIGHGNICLIYYFTNISRN